MKCPESIEELEEMEKQLPLCRVTLYNHAKARIEAGSAKSVSEAARQIAEEIGKSANTVRSAINEGMKSSDDPHHLAEITGTAKYAPTKRNEPEKEPEKAEDMEQKKDEKEAEREEKKERPKIDFNNPNQGAVAVRYARMAIADLAMIQRTHYDRREAFDLVIEWIKNNR